MPHRQLFRLLDVPADHVQLEIPRHELHRHQSLPRTLLVPAARDRVEETTDGAAHDERRDHGVSQCRGGLAPAASLKDRLTGQAASALLSRRVRWARASYGAVHDFLTNPAYAGAFVFGRTAQRRPHGDKAGPGPDRCLHPPSQVRASPLRLADTGPGSATRTKASSGKFPICVNSVN